jgi:hypothetical protein
VSTGAYAPLALVALGGVVVLWGRAIYQGRQVRQVQRRAAERGALATRVAPERLAELRARRAPSSGGAPSRSRRGLVTAAALGLLIVVLAGAGAWWLWLRDDGKSGHTAQASAASQPAVAKPTSLGPDPGTVVPRVLPVLPREPSYYRVSILNATTVNGAARRLVAPRVEGAGFSLGRVGDAPSNAEARSVVMFPPGRRAVALSVARDLGIHRVSPMDGVPEALTGPVDAVVIVGRDLARG